VVAGDQATDLLGSLVVHADRMGRTLDAAHDDVHAEQRSLADLAGRAPRGDYLGATDAFVEAPLARAAAVLADPDPTTPQEIP
jgi:3-carboxy-cis,cis-muconate cycloisomerase